MFPEKQTTILGGRVISRMGHKGQNGWCCGEKKCTAHNEGFHTSFTEAVFCEWGTAPIQDIAKMFTTVGKVTLEDYERAEPEQILSLLQKAVAANVFYLGKNDGKMDRDYARREREALGYIQSLLPAPSGRLWHFLSDADAMFRSLLVNPNN